MNEGVLLESRQIVLDRDGRSCIRCDRPATDVHHRQARGMGGGSDAAIHSPVNLISLCRDCHSWIHSRPHLAEMNGWRVARGFLPEDVRLRWHGQTALLTPGGTVLL